MSKHPWYMSDEPPNARDERVMLRGYSQALADLKRLEERVIEDGEPRHAKVLAGLKMGVAWLLRREGELSARIEAVRVTREQAQDINQ